MGKQFRVPGSQRFGRRTVRDDAEQHGDGDDGDGAICSGAVESGVNSEQPQVDCPLQGL